MPRTIAAWRNARHALSSTAIRAAGYGLGMGATGARVAPWCNCVGRSLAFVTLRASRLSEEGGWSGRLESRAQDSGVQGSACRDKREMPTYQEIAKLTGTGYTATALA